MTPVRIVHPTDFSDVAEHAQAQAIRLARLLGAELILLHVAVETSLFGEGAGMVEVEKVYAAQRQWAEQALASRAAAAIEAGVTARWVLTVGTPVDEIVRFAGAERADFVVIGTHGRTGVDRFLLGSVAERVIRLAPCPVVAVRRPTGRDGDVRA